MDLALRDLFLLKWKKYFGDAELPFVFFYSADLHQATPAAPPAGRSCVICELSKVRKGQSLAYTEQQLRCGGARRYFGYSDGMRKNFEYFLSCGIPGVMEGERYIRTPGMVNEIMENMEKIPAGDQYIIFKRWDKLEADDEPVAAIFFATPDVLSGLFTLANFDQVDGNGTIAPFGSGCSSIVFKAWLENREENPRAILGMFDPSARPCVPANTLSYSVPMKKFEKMIGYMDESFLITESWDKIRNRMQKER